MASSYEVISGRRLPHTAHWPTTFHTNAGRARMPPIRLLRTSYKVRLCVDYLYPSQPPDRQEGVILALRPPPSDPAGDCCYQSHIPPFPQTSHQEAPHPQRRGHHGSRGGSLYPGSLFFIFLVTRMNFTFTKRVEGMACACMSVILK